MTSPLFSVLLPTYNRSEFLPLAIQSILDQTLGDFELIISDGGSSDDTQKVVKNFNDRRIRYLHSSTRLGMNENYERVLRAANGEFLVFFSDDDALVPHMLEKVNSVISETESKMVVFPFAKYFHEDSIDGKSRKNTLEFSDFTSKVWSVNSSVDIGRMSVIYGLADKEVQTDSISPLIGNVVFHRSIIENLSSRVAMFFATVPVDIYVITLFLCSINEYSVLDEPLLVWSNWTKNSSVAIKKDLKAHYKKLLGGKELDQVPLKFHTPRNCAANALLLGLSDAGRSEILDPNWAIYSFEMLRDLIFLKGEGVEISSEDLDQANQYFLAFFSNKKRGFSRKIQLRYASFKATIKRSSIRKLVSKQSNGNIGKVIISGNTAGFSNFLEAGKYLDEIIYK